MSKRYFRMAMEWIGMAVVIALLIIATLSLGGCSADWHARRAALKNPELLKPQTITVVDTVVVPGDTIDRSFVTTVHDTIEVVKDRAVVRIVRRYDTLQVFAECPPDTIIRPVQVDCPPQIVVDDKPDWGERSMWVLLGICVSIILFWVLARR